jgi:hypothetical protein
MDTALELPYAFENRIFSKFYKSAMPIYEFSSDVEGAHMLNFSFFDSYALLGNHAKIENIYLALEALRIRLFALGKRLFNEVNNHFNSKHRAIVSSVVTPTEFKDTNIGEFSHDFSSYQPVNKNIDEIKFTPAQAEVMKILCTAFYEKPGGRITKSQLIKELYSSKKASGILDRISKAKKNKPKVRNEYRYDWRLEKSIFKKANHPIWKLGFIKTGIGAGDEKTFFLDFSFETNAAKRKKS